MTLREEIAQGENVALEFKEARPKDSLKYLKTVVAFANGRGGRILLGVEDGTGRLVGIPREKVAKEMDALTDAIANSCTPPVSVEVRPTVLGGKSLIAVDEGWGGGVSRYFESCEKLGLPLPIVEETAGCVKVVFLRRRITANGGNGGNGGGNGGYRKLVDLDQ